MPATNRPSNIDRRERLIHALDVATADEARRVAEALGDAVVFYKIGLELLLGGEAFALIDWLRERDKKIFVDVKLFDVPRTVARAVAQLARRGIDFATVHGNDDILRAAVDSKGDVRLLAVTALSSLDQRDMEMMGFPCDIETLVGARAANARKLGCDGVVCAGSDIAKLRRDLDPDMLVVTPGVRPADAPRHDQKRVTTPRAALEAGADYIVVGRWIAEAEDPRRHALELQAIIEQCFPAAEGAA